MNRCYLKPLILLIFTIVCWPFYMPCQAQNDTTTTHKSNYFDTVEIYNWNVWHTWMINFHAGAGFSTFRDAAISPITYHGGTLLPGLDVQLTHNVIWHYSLETKINIGGYEDATNPRWNFSTAAGSYSIRMLVMRDIHPEKDLFLLSYCAGFSLNNDLWMNYNPNLDNASFGLTDFVNLTLHGKVYYTFKTKRHSKYWTLEAQLGLTPLSFIYRPGYTYVDNYSANNSGLLGATFSSYTWNLKAFSGTETMLSIKKHIGMGNTIGLSYYWNFFTTGTTNYYRFEESNHMLSLDLNICLHP